MQEFTVAKPRVDLLRLFRYYYPVMKTGIHPELKTTKVHCNGCNINFETAATVDSITVEICSDCHPFYTGKQKLVDTAGRVEKFRARTEAAKAKKAASSKAPKAEADTDEVVSDNKPANDPELKEVAAEFKAETVDLPEADVVADAAEVIPETDTPEA